ncbi:dTDP-4-dehydrorhamnose reductase [Aeromonas hydrophila]|uniref:dTDP-4-dehydrorhamnose reductase n=1 Tax=Aeromonas hydrophila TaxID=644 RepID=UPI002B47C3A6|nr:dTDP-4-dehydrorhamnose reductase [Aeromonas hydrophila]
MNNHSLILLLGGEGQLGLSLFQLAGKEHIILPKRTDVDLLYPERLANLVTRLRPTVVINAAAYTSVEHAEINPELAYKINTKAVEALANAAKNIGALLVHFSTDYVFDGCGDKPWCESDKPAPLNVYGLSKWQGEQAIIASGCRRLVLRTSWLHSPYRANFLKTMLHLAPNHSSLQIVCDQVGAPTSARMLAEATFNAISQTLTNPVLEGTYHVVASGYVSWYEYAKFIFQEALHIGMLNCTPSIFPVTSSNYESKVHRPLNSRLDTKLFSDTFGFDFSSWEAGVVETIRQLSINKST